MGGWVRFAASGAFYVGLTAFWGRDVLAQLGTSIAADAGDPLLTAAILHWNAWTLPLSHAWWQFPIFYPTADALAISEHLLGLSVIATPVAWIVRDPLVTYNLVTLLTFPLCALAAFALVHRLTGSAAGGFIAGLAFGFSPYRISQLSHVQVLATFWAPLALLGLHAYLESGRRRWLALYGAAWTLQAAANSYCFFMLSALVGVWLIWFVVARRRWRAFAEITLASVVGCAVLLPILLTYLRVMARHGFERGVGEVDFFSADIAAVLCTAPELTLWGWLQVACRAEGALFPGGVIATVVVAAFVGVARSGGAADRASAHRLLSQVSRLSLAIAIASAAAILSLLVVGPWRVDWGLVRVSVSSVPKPLMIGLAAGLCALVTSRGVWLAWRRSSVAGFYLLAGLVMWLFALGPSIVLMGQPRGFPGPFLLLRLLPGAEGLRVPARFWVMTTLCLAVVAGLVVARLVRGRGRFPAAAIVAGLATGLLADTWVSRINTAPAPAPVPDARPLRGGVVLTLPAGEFDFAAVYQAVVGGWTAVNGYSGYEPNHYHAIRLASREGLDELFEPFRSAGDLHVVVPAGDGRLRALVERQPGAGATGTTASFVQYRLPKLNTAALIARGEQLPIRRVAASCASGEASKTIDGDLATRWSCGLQSGDEVVTVDLDRPMMVGAVRHYPGPPREFPRQLTIETSIDGAQWEHVRAGNVTAPVIRGAFEHTRWPAMAFPFEPRLARYVRLRQLGRDEWPWSIGEIEVLGGRR